MTKGRRQALCILAAATGVLAVPFAGLATNEGFGWHPGGGGSCKITKVYSITPSAANLGAYTPPDAVAAVPVDITISLKAKGSGTCKGALTFYRQTLPAKMLGGGSGSGERPYQIRSAPTGGASLMFASWPPANRTLDFTVRGGGVRNVTLTVYVAAQAGWLNAGNYADHITLKVLDRRNGGYDIVKYKPFAVTSTVQQACDLPPPDVLNLNFSSAITKGLPNGTTLTATFTAVACSAPARIRLSGAPLINPAIQPVGNFDNFIDWEASATFGDAAVVLDTRQTNQVTSSGQNVGSGPTTAATITISVRLLPGQRILAGHYSNILTVTIDPVL